MAQEQKDATVERKAINRIELQPGVFIEPGTTFPCPCGQVVWLAAQGAITEVKRVAPVEAYVRAAGPVVDAAGSGDEGEVPLEDMTVEALMEVCHGLGINAHSNWRADTMIKKIKAAQAAQTADPAEDLV